MRMEEVGVAWESRVELKTVRRVRWMRVRVSLEGVGGVRTSEGEVEFCLRRRGGLNKRQLRFLDGGTFAGFSPLELRSCLGFDGEPDWVFFSTMTFPSKPTSLTTKSSYLLSIPIN